MLLSNDQLIEIEDLVSHTLDNLQEAGYTDNVLEVLYPILLQGLVQSAENNTYDIDRLLTDIRAIRGLSKEEKDSLVTYMKCLE